MASGGVRPAYGSGGSPQRTSAVRCDPGAQKQRIVVFGAGAVGCLVGGLLHQAGHDVAFVGRRGVVDAIRTSGIRIAGLWGESAVSSAPMAYETAREIPEDFAPSLILITTKSYATAAAIEACQPLAGESTLVCSLQNGVGNLETIARCTAWERTIGGRIITGVEIASGEPGLPVRIQVTVHADDIRLGHPHGSVAMERIETIASVWREAGVRVQASEDLVKYIWAKVFYNAALNPLGAILGVCYGDLAEHPSTCETMNRIIEEGFAVTQAHGVEHFWPDAEAYRKAFYTEMVPKTAKHFPSMLRDIQQGRRTEIGALNGAIVELATEKAIDAPANRAIVEMISFLESRKS